MIAERILNKLRTQTMNNFEIALIICDVIICILSFIVVFMIINDSEYLK